MALADDPNRYEDFLFRSGIDALSREVRGAISDVEAFRERRDREDFISHRGWAALSEEDRTQAGSPKALAEEDTEEKLALLERLGRATLSAERRQELESRLRGATRSEAGDPALFQQKYGEEALREHLRTSDFSGEVVAPQLYITRLSDVLGYLFTSDWRGHLLRGSELLYRVQVMRHAGDRQFLQPYALILRRGEPDGNRSRFEWRVDGRMDEVMGRRADRNAPLL